LNLRSFKNIILIAGIPLSVSLSWILGGELVKKISPLVLSSSRMLVGIAIMILFSNINATQRGWSRNQRLEWWRNQLILAITGRTLYYYFSSRALLSISPLDALLVTSLMPVFSLFMERIFGARFRTLLLPTSGLLASGFAFAAVASSRKAGVSASSALGYLEIIGAVVSFSLHLSLYGRVTKDDSPVNPLMVQFAIGAACLLPADLSGYQAFSHFSATDWGHFAVYAAVCNLLPFVLVHYALKIVSPLTVASASVVSPLFGIVVVKASSGTSVEPSFVVFSLCAVVLTWATIKLNLKEKSREALS
jgi:drug/metabolite transporter (DMT)-like permease